MFLVRDAVGPSGGITRLWGEIDPGELWGDRETARAAPQGYALCVIDRGSAGIYCDGSGTPDTLTRIEGATGDVLWSDRDTAQVGGYWSMFLKAQYAAPAWLVVVSQPRDAVTAPLVGFRNSFVAAIAVALLTVFLLGNILLRRTMTPLETLSVATKRIASGELSHRAPIESEDEFGAVANSFNAMAAGLERQFGLQEVLNEIDRSALAGRGAGAVFASALRRGGEILPACRVVLAVADPEDPDTWRAGYRDRRGDSGEPVSVRPSPQERMALEAHPELRCLSPAQELPGYVLPGEGTREGEILIQPMARDGHVTGMVAWERPRGQGISEEDRTRARQYADRLALAFENTALVHQLDALTLGSLTALARAIDAVSPWTAGHSERVAMSAEELGRRLGLPEPDLKLLQRGGLLHDMGKIGIPASILDKAGPLTPDELRQVRDHTTIGARILSPIPAFRPMLPLVLSHHELLDGSGYPSGLSGEQIPIVVRIITVADVFDALTSRRPYRDPWSHADALRYLMDGAGSAFDADAVTALASALRDGWTPGDKVPEPGPPSPRPLADLALGRDQGSRSRHPGLLSLPR